MTESFFYDITCFQVITRLEVRRSKFELIRSIIAETENVSSLATDSF